MMGGAKGLNTVGDEGLAW